MKQNIHIQLAAEVIRALRQDPRQANNDLAQRLGVSEGFVRRYRAALELAEIVPMTPGRIGSDGILRTMPTV